MIKCIKGDDGLILAAGYSFHILKLKIYGFFLTQSLQETTPDTYI